MPGVIDTLKIVYAVDVVDKGTKHLLASERAAQKSVVQTSRALAQQDTAQKRSATIVQQTSRRRLTALHQETGALRRAAAANDRLASSTRRANQASIARRGATAAGGTVRGAVAGATAFVSIAGAKQAISVTEELAKTTLSLNKNLGLGVEQASRWAAVARVRGIDSKQLNQAFGTLSKNIGAANRAQDKYRGKLDELGSSEKDQAKRQQLIAKGAGDQVAAFNRLGISTKELADNDFDATLKRAADGLAALPAGAERTALAMKLFGRGWQTIVPIMRGGSKAMDEQLKLADKYGVTFRGKTVGSLMELVAAQREAKFASLGLQVAFGTQVAPALTKAINAGSGFVRQMRDGTGAGGRFAAQAKSIADDLRPVGEQLQTVGAFLADHPHLVLAAAGAYAAFKATRGTLRIVRDIKDIGGAIRATTKLAAKSSIATSIASGASGTGRLVRRALGGVKGVIQSVMGGAGRAGGITAAERIAQYTGSEIGPALDRNQKAFRGGRWSRMGRIAGKSFGVAAAVVIAGEITTEVTSWLKKQKWYKPPGGKGSFWDNLIPEGLLPHKRAGGIVGRYQHGGLVPLMASGGELLVDGARATMIPGPSDRDATPMLARPGAAILTGDGQARMSMGASLAQAIAHQAPHFAKGGVVPGKYTATAYGPPWGGIQGTGITSTQVNLKRNPQIYGIAVDPRMIALGSKVFAHPNPFGYTGRFAAFDTGGAIRGRRIDFYDWRGRDRQHAWGKRTVTVSRSRIAPKQDGEDTYRSRGGRGTETAVRVLGRSRRRAGLLGDAFEQGRAAGQAGLKLAQSPVLQAIKDALAAAGTQPDKGTAASKATVEAADTGGFASGSRLARMHTKAAAIDAKRYQYAYGGGHQAIGAPNVGPRTPRGGRRGLGYDCSGAVSAVLGAGGLLKAPLTSGGLMSWGAKGQSKDLAVYTDPAHVIMRLGRRYFGTGEANPNGGAGWLPNNTMKGRGVVRTWRARGASRRGAASAPRAPISDRVMGYRSGGTVTTIGPNRGITAGATGGAGRSLSAALRNAMTFAGGSFDALDKIIARAAEQRLIALREQIERRVKKGGPAKIVQRLQGVLDKIDGELGDRVGLIEYAVEQRTTQLERRRGQADRALRIQGTDPSSAAGAGAMGAFQAAETKVRRQNVASLTSALQRATRQKNQEAIADLTTKLHDAQDALQESMVRQVELWRDQIRATGAEAVSNAEFRLGWQQTGVSLIEAHQRLNRTQDTPEGMRDRAGVIQTSVIPAMEAARAQHLYNAQLLASIGDVEGWRQAMQSAYSATVDLANAQADAADLIRDAAARAAQDTVDRATHGRTMHGLELDKLELEQRLIGTYDSTGGAQGRADYIRDQILPAIQAEITALVAQQAVAQQAGDQVLANQIAEAIAAKTNESLQAQIDARDSLKDIAGDLKEFGGSIAFSYREMPFLDSSPDVIRARIGA